MTPRAALAGIAGSGNRIAPAVAQLRDLAASRMPPALRAGTAVLAARARAGWTRLQDRLAARGPQREAQSLLCLAVSESGWRATLRPGDGTPAIETAETAGPDEAALSAPDMLRRAVRAISPATRDGIGSIRLVIHDRATSIIDNRVLKLRSVDPVAIRQAGAQELGSTGAVYGFQPFGSSSEHEMERGVYAFLPAGRMSDYLGAMDSLAVKLTQVVPAWLLRFGAERQPFAAIEIRGESVTLVVADPDSGAVACRELPVGTRSFAEAVARATSVSVREAAEGLERRACLAPGAGPHAAPGTTELALAPLLATLRAELLATVEYFVFQRLAGMPERLVVGGDAARVRGLAEWLGTVLALDPHPADLHGVAPDEAGALNLLHDTPAGLLKIGRTDYRFVDGRFQSVQAQGRPTSRAAPRSHASLRGLAGQPLTPAVLRQTAAAVAAAARTALPGASALAPALAAAILGAGLWGTVEGAAGAATRAGTQLSSRLADDALLRHAALHPHRPVQDHGAPGAQPWSAKLSRMAALIPDGIWLTSLTTLPDPATPAQQRIVLEGTLPSPDGEDYVARIAGFIDRLAADPAFMKDVVSIGFEGAAIGQGAAAAVATFTISVVLAPAFASPAAAPGAASAAASPDAAGRG
jgi:Tfp pilus assembly protein PilN